ncbi:DNA polymerase/3'-5' exonuclease PolX [Patescibacteria group bacterium]
MTKPHKFTNKEIVVLFKEVLAAMEIKEFNRFRIRAYQNLIPVLESLTMSVYNLWESNRLFEIPGVGDTIKGHLDELFKTGKVTEFDAVMHDLPQGMFSLIGLRGVGAKKAYKLAKAFELNDRKTAQQAVKEAAEKGLIKDLEGFAEKSEQLILEALKGHKKTKSEKARTLLFRAEQVAERVLNYLEKFPEVEKVEVVGSFRRRRPTVGDIEFAIATKDPEATTNYFLKYPEIDEVLVSGKSRSSVVIGDDIQVDTRVSDPKIFGSMVQYFTGSKVHNINLRTYTLDRGYSLSEYGIKETSTGKVHEFDNEEDFYEFLKLPWIPPEIRQGTEEIELAQKNKLPELIKLEDIKGDLHTHTILSDGVSTLQEMVEAAREREYEYIGITDHAPSVQSRGYDEVKSIIEKTRINVAKFNAAQKDIKVLFGYEVNILADATLSVPDDLLKELDFVIAGIHTAFDQPEEQIMKRLTYALEHPLVDILAHPSGRIINQREPYAVNWQKILKTASENNKILEIDANPHRLDLPEDLVQQAVKRAIPVVINSDAHDVNQFDFMKYGIDVAKRGWCEKEHVVNTLGVDELLKYFKR